MGFPEVWTPLPRCSLTLGLSPLRHLTMVAGEQDLGDVEPFERPRSGELRMFEEPVLETLFDDTGGLAQHAGQQPYARLDGHQGSRLAAGEHRVPHRDFLE